MIGLQGALLHYVRRVLAQLPSCFIHESFPASLSLSSVASIDELALDLEGTVFRAGCPSPRVDADIIDKNSREADIRQPFTPTHCLRQDCGEYQRSDAVAFALSLAPDYWPSGTFMHTMDQHGACMPALSCVRNPRLRLSSCGEFPSYLLATLLYSIVL